MAKSTTQIVFHKPDINATAEYVVYVNPEEYKKWKDGDTSIPLSQVVESFKIWHSNQGHQGHLGQASKQQLDTDFGTHKDDEVVKLILEKGKNQAGDGIASTGQPNTNISRGSRAQVNTGGK